MVEPFILDYAYPQAFSCKMLGAGYLLTERSSGYEFKATSTNQITLLEEAEQEMKGYKKPL